MKIWRNSQGPAGTLYLPESSLAKTTLEEALLYLQREGGRRVALWSGDPRDLADLKEEAIRKHFLFLSGGELKSLVAWHREKALQVPPETWAAFAGDTLAGMGSLERIDDQRVLLCSGYGRLPGAVAALTALRIAEAEYQGYQKIEGEVFRANSGGAAHLRRWGFQPTGRARKSRTTNDQMIDIWSKTLRG